MKTHRFLPLLLTGLLLGLSFAPPAQVPDPGQRLLRQKAAQRVKDVGKELQDQVNDATTDADVDSGTTATETTTTPTTSLSTASTTVTSSDGQR